MKIEFSRGVLRLICREYLPISISVGISSVYLSVTCHGNLLPNYQNTLRNISDTRKHILYWILSTTAQTQERLNWTDNETKLLFWHFIKSSLDICDGLDKSLRKSSIPPHPTLICSSLLVVALSMFVVLTLKNLISTK